MSQDWRTETNAEEYFGHQRKTLDLANRRPVLWKAGDLVGPGIGANAVRLTDFNDTLATYNGFYSSDVGASNGPDSSVTTLTTALVAGASVSLLQVSALTASIEPGTYVQVSAMTSTGLVSQVFVANTSRAIGATNIQITPATLTLSFAVGSRVGAGSTYIGDVTSDSQLGGRQVFTNLASRVEYTRVFSRNPSDPDFISWGPWTRDITPTPMARTPLNTASSTSVPGGGGFGTPLVVPPFAFSGLGSTFSTTTTPPSLNVLRPGLYQGSLNFFGYNASDVRVYVTLPDSGVEMARPLLPLWSSFNEFSVDFPVAFRVTTTPAALRFSAINSQASPVVVYGGTGSYIVRVGD